MPKPLIFIGSSTEGLNYAKAIQAELQYAAECVIWSQGIFGLSEGTLESLVNALDKFDFAILVLTPDDLVESRGNSQPAPRDNVLLELGMFIGGLGRSRTFMVVDRSAKLKLPSDLAGITPATFEPPKGGTVQSAVGPACTAIEEAIERLRGRNAEWPVELKINTRGYATAWYGVKLVVKNCGKADLPPYTIEIYHPKYGQKVVSTLWESKSLLPHQSRESAIEFRGRDEPFSFQNPVDHNLPRLVPNESDDDGFELRLVLEDSDKILFSNKRIARAFVRLMRRWRSGDDECLDGAGPEWAEMDSNLPDE